MRKRVDKLKAIPAAGEGKRGPEGHLAYLLRQGGAAARLALERKLADLDVTPPQFSVLTMIGAYGPVWGADLARLTLLTPQTINVIVRNLQRRGAITKTPDPVHGRILRLTVTEAGKRLLEKCKVRADAIDAQLLAPLGKQEERTVRNWLVAITRLAAPED